jgi:hypothetical protein
MPGFSSEERLLGRFKYKVTQVGHRDALDLLSRLGRIVSPALKSNLTKASKDGGALFEGLRDLVSQIDDAQINHFAKVLGKKTLVFTNPAKPEFSISLEADGHRDELYPPDHLLEFFEWLAFALEVNFSTFFVGAGSRLGLLSPKAKASSGFDSPQESTPASSG